MRTVLHGPVFQGNKQVKQYARNFAATELKDDLISIDQNGVKGSYREVLLDGIVLESRDISVEQPYSVNVRHTFPLFKLHFEVEGSNRYVSEDEKIAVHIPAGHYNMFFLPKVKGDLYFEQGKRKTLEIIFTEAYIQKVIGKDFKLSLKRLGEAIESGSPFFLWEQSRPISAQLLSLIDDIKSCSYSGAIKKAYLEAKVMEMLVIILAKVNEHNEHADSRGHLSDPTKISMIEAYIRAHLFDDLKINKLATIAGINTSKLKQDFKQRYASTIFQYISSLRMEQAKKLLEDRGLSVAQVALEVGYKNPQHFTVAFKKKYGVLPKNVKNNG